MICDDQQQLDLFGNSPSPSRSPEQSSPALSERETSSNEPETSTTGAASPTTQTARARVRSQLAGAVTAAKLSPAARATAAAELQRTLPSVISQRLTDPMLAIPRPKTRADCQAEARPCPWVGCRHHLLLEVAKAKPKDGREARATSLRLNQPSRGAMKLGRRPGLASSSAAALVQVWIDDALELLSRMRFTCALDVVEAYPDGLPPSAIGWILGVSEGAIDQGLNEPHVREALDELRREYLDP